MGAPGAGAGGLGGAGVRRHRRPGVAARARRVLARALCASEAPDTSATVIGPGQNTTHGAVIMQWIELDRQDADLMADNQDDLRCDQPVMNRVIAEYQKEIDRLHHRILTKAPGGGGSRARVAGCRG